MSDALAAVEAAIADATKARKLVAKNRSRQVWPGEERDRLKAVAFAWFQKHRQPISAHSCQPNLDAVNSAYQAVLVATGGAASRKTYLDALLSAKNALVAVMGTLAIAAPVANTTVATPDAAPNFAPLASDPQMQAILQRRWQEVQLCMGGKAYLSATVMMGGLLESLLLARINESPTPAAVFTAKSAARDKAGKTLPINDWKLTNMIDVAHELKWVTKSAKDVGHVLREFRNYIHPHKEFVDKVTIEDEDAKMFWEVTKAITRQVLASAGKSP